MHVFYACLPVFIFFVGTQGWARAGPPLGGGGLVWAGQAQALELAKGAQALKGAQAQALEGAQAEFIKGAWGLGPSRAPAQALKEAQAQASEGPGPLKGPRPRT